MSTERAKGWGDVRRKKKKGKAKFGSAKENGGEGAKRGAERNATYHQRHIMVRPEEERNRKALGPRAVDGTVPGGNEDVVCGAERRGEGRKREGRAGGQRWKEKEELEGRGKREEGDWTY